MYKRDLLTCSLVHFLTSSFQCTQCILGLSWPVSLFQPWFLRSYPSYPEGHLLRNKHTYDSLTIKQLDIKICQAPWRFTSLWPKLVIANSICCFHPYTKGTIVVITVWFKDTRTFECSCTIYDATRTCSLSMYSRWLYCVSVRILHWCSCTQFAWDYRISNHRQKGLLLFSRVCLRPAFRTMSKIPSFCWPCRNRNNLNRTCNTVYYLSLMIWSILSWRVNSFDPVKLSVLFCCVYPRSLLQ